MNVNPNELEMLLHDLRTSKDSLEELEGYYKEQKGLILNDIIEVEKKLNHLVPTRIVTINKTLN